MAINYMGILALIAVSLFVGQTDAAVCAKYDAVTLLIPNPLTVPQLRIPLDFGAAAQGEMSFNNGIDISNLKTINYDECDMNPNAAMWHSVMDVLDIHFNNYTLDGTLVGHMDIYGSGEGHVNIEQLDVLIWGNGTENADELLQLDYAWIDLEIYRWTVNFENIMPGTDMGLLFNEFFTMVGPETIDAIEAALNTSLNDLFLTLVNQILEAIWANGASAPEEKTKLAVEIIKNFLTNFK